ncbi:MAG TPA: bifunctional nuclease family protein [Dermatophilaceae bacterium]|nr:bifunctional nuclease family protein [Dermatophilaceae bacterium]
MIEVEVMGVRVDMPTNQPIVVLREREGDRYLPIWVGAAEATAIAYVQQGIEPPRPLTHDLMATLLTSLDHTLTVVRVDRLVEKVFFATLLIDGHEVSARPSDGIALALRVGCPVLVAPAVMDEAGIVIGPDEDDEVARFREFLDQVSAEDFDSGSDSLETEPDS